MTAREIEVLNKLQKALDLIIEGDTHAVDAFDLIEGANRADERVYGDVTERITDILSDAHEAFLAAQGEAQVLLDSYKADVIEG